MSAASRDPSRVQEVVTAHVLHLVRRARHQVIDRIRIALSPQRLAIGSKRESALAGGGKHAAAMFVFSFTKYELAEYQKAARCAIDRDAPLHSRIVTRCDGADRDDAIRQRV